MSDWNSAQYLKFKNERTQPAVDLAMSIKNNPKTIVDIGCGPGNSTQVLWDVFPDADILGIDNSPNMIEKAKIEHSDIDFRLCDALSLDGKYDLLFSNACLQWIPDHGTLIPSLMEKLNDGGILAVQVPMNSDEPLFRLIREVANEPKWGLSDVKLQPNETLTPPEYYNILSACSSAFDMWEVKYYHTMPDHKIQRTITYNRGELVISPPKTEEGKRTVYLPNTLRSVLSERKKTAVSEWIFHNLLNPSEPVRPQTAYNRLKKLLKEAKLDTMRFHDIRHSFSSVSANIGIAPQILSGIVGHTKASFTLDTYAHVTTAMQKNASKIVENYITDIFGKELKPWQSEEKAEKV